MNKVYVWDPVVRVFHWSLVISFIVAYLTGEDESLIHTYAGYVILALIVTRIIWGFIGSKYARFSSFLTSPATAIRYLMSLVRNQHPRRYLGHNPAGGWMILALFLGLGMTIYSGLELEALEGHGPLAQSTATQPNSHGIIISTAIADGPEHAESHGKVAGDKEEEEGHEFWEEIHEFFANFTVFLVILHIAGVLFSSLREKENLVRAMISGYKKSSD